MAYIGSPQPRKISSLQTPFSRFGSTKVFVDNADSKVFFGTWNPPRVYETKSPVYHVVTADELYRPDLIAWRVYKNPNLFWPISLRNGISFPFIELTAGQILTCPHIDDVSAAVSNVNGSNRQV
jgi:hypothetical protein